VPWSVAFNSELAVVEVTLEGKLDRADRIAANEEAFASVDANNARKFFLDARSYESSLARVNVFFLADSYRDERFRPGKIAVIQPTSKEAQEDAAFFETVCMNRGWMARVFPGRSEAVEWLLAD
jgi:hypothetical protein